MFKKYLPHYLILLSISFLAGFASAEPKDLPEVEAEPSRVFQTSKNVTCTSDAYDLVKENFVKSHGEVGVIRFVSDIQTGVEVIGNVETGTITILEFIPSTKMTCFISMGKHLEINTILFGKSDKGIQTSY